MTYAFALRPFLGFFLGFRYIWAIGHSEDFARIVPLNFCRIWGSWAQWGISSDLFSMIALILCSTITRKLLPVPNVTATAEIHGINSQKISLLYPNFSTEAEIYGEQF